MGRLTVNVALVLVASALTPRLVAADGLKAPEERSGTDKPASPELRRAWLDTKGVVPAENQVAVAALCWAVKEQMRDKPFTAWLSGRPIQVDWPLDERFERFAALDLFNVLPQGITEDHLRRAWLDLYGLPLTDKDKERAAVNWITLQHKHPG